ncbi:Sensory box histidine kinase/response regulator [hydrothermal vent metagenome]|uniref:histidine kinase n=1 Tax=hydrothermal vent metagenome TaxID=652676 RepID=A0A3B1CYG0_9ZZZZ
MSNTEQDIFKQKSLEEKILNKILILSTGDFLLKDILCRVIEEILAIPWLKLLPRAGIFLTAEDGKTLKLIAHKNFVQQIQISCANIAFGQCLCGRAAATKEIQFSSCIDHRHEISYEGIKPHGHYNVPILENNNVMGVLAIYLPQGHAYNESEVQFLKSITNVCSLIIRKKYSEQELVFAKEEALAAAKSKSDFLANMSHEIRTPMNSILGFSALLTKTKIDEDQKKFLNIIQSSGELLLGIINDILDISKIEAGKIVLESVSFDLKILINDVFSMIVARMKDKPFDTYIDIDENIPRYYQGDPTRLKQILVNLLGNAVKFTSQGEIGLIVRQEKSRNVIEEEILLCFIVKDSGIGIPKDKLENIFESFSQADDSTTRTFGGTGLGLSISRALVEKMEGRIWAESEKGKGSEFIFIINLKKETGSSKEVKEKIDKQLKGKKVFIVDDNQISRKILNKCCEKMGLKVYGVADCSEAALHKLDKLASTQGIIPDLILCDIMMEGMDGYEFVARVRLNEQYEKTKFIAVTANLGADLTKNNNEKGFDHVMGKPITVEHLVSVVTKSLLLDKKTNIGLAKIKKDLSCQGVKILVVEDVAANTELIKVYFDILGCIGDFVENGQEAITKLKVKNNYDLCLMDIQMPIMDGLEATKIIRKEISKDFPIIALTASIMKEEQKDAYIAGMSDFLTKPIDILKLKEKILYFSQKNKIFL